MKKSILLTLYALFAAAVLSAVEPAAFVDIGAGARASGMGGAFTAVADDANAVFYNPAGMATSKMKDITFMYAKQKDIVPYNYTAFVFPINKERAAGFGMIISGDALLDEKSFTLSYSENLDKILFIIKDFYVGTNIKLQFASFGNNEKGAADRMIGNAWGVGGDLGFLWRVTENVSAGLMLRDIYSYLNWTSSYLNEKTSYMEKIPMTNSIGLMYREGPLTVAADISDFDRLRLGLEATLFGYVDLRGGYIQSLDIESYKEYSVGLGVGHFEFGRVREFSANFDVAYLFERLGNTMRIQASFKFK